MTGEELLIAAEKIKAYGALTVNERLYLSGLIEEFDHARLADKRKARKILILLEVDDPSNEKILRP